VKTRYLSLLMLAALTACPALAQGETTPWPPVMSQPVQVTSPADGYAPESLWTGARATSLFSDLKAYRVGDLVTVVVSESVISSLSGGSKLSKSAQGAGQHGVGMLSLLGDYSYGEADNFSSAGSFSHNDQLAATVTAVVEEVTEAGALRVRGERQLNLNGEERKLSLSGLVRTQDIGPSNTVASSALAEAIIKLDGKGSIAKKRKPGILSRLFDWLF